MRNKNSDRQYASAHGQSSALIAVLILAALLTPAPGPAAAQSITEFTIPTSSSWPVDIAAGPDGNLWFTEAQAFKVGRILVSSPNTITEFTVPTSNSDLGLIAAGPDGNLWFVEQSGNKIGRVNLPPSPTSTATVVPTPTPVAGPVACFTVVPDPACRRQSVSFDASCSTVGTYPIASYSWDFGDGSLASSSPNPTYTYSYSYNGTYTASLLLTDSGSPPRTAIAVHTVSVTDDHAPVANAGGPYFCTVGQPVTFDGSASSDPDAWCGDYIALYEWDLNNDGVFTDASGPSPTVTVTCSAAFSSTIRLRVTDSFGATNVATSSLSVTTPISSPSATSTSAPTATNTPTSTATATPTSTPTNTPTVTPIPTATPEDSGFVPPNKAALTCEQKVGTNINTLQQCIDQCHSKAAAALRLNKAFDVEACESTNPVKSCRAKYDKAAAKLVAAGTCPACLGATQQAALAAQAETASDATNGALYCGGSAEALPVGQFSLSGKGPTGITVGPDGNPWFTEYSSNQIGKVTTAGTVTEYVVPTLYSGPQAITAGPDGSLWFTETNVSQIGKVTTAGAFAEYPILTVNGGPQGITTGPDGNLWFTEDGANRIGRITVGGSVTEFPIPVKMIGPFGITAGPDGSLWFTVSSSNAIGRIAADDPGLVAPDPRTLSCEQKVAGNIGTLRKCIATCHSKAAAAALKGSTFDEDACESTDAVKSCRAKYDKAAAKFVAAGTCPPCLGAAEQAALADQTEVNANNTNGGVYCGGTVPLTP